MFSRWCSLVALASILQDAACQAFDKEQYREMMKNPEMQEMKAKLEKMSPDERDKLMEQMKAQALPGHGGIEPGMGASFPGMDGPGEQKPPEPKVPVIAVKRALALLKEIIATLYAADNKVELDTARKGKKREELGPLIGPIIERLSKPVLLKFEMEGGFQDAMAAVKVASQRRHNKKLRRELMNLNDAMLGEKNPANAMFVPELDVLADKFLNNNEAERADAIAKTEKALEKLTVDGKLTVSGADVYLTTMKGVSKRGYMYIEDLIVELAGPQSAKAKADKDAALKIEMTTNILMEFLRTKDHESIEKRMQKVLAESAPPSNEQNEWGIGQEL